MPYVKEKEDPIAPMLRAAGVTDGAKLAKVLGCTHPTALRKLREPWRLTVEDLRRIHRIGHVPIDAIREAL